MNWFEEIFGFYESQSNIDKYITIKNNILSNSLNHKSHDIGDFSTLSLGELKLKLNDKHKGVSNYKEIFGNVKDLHLNPSNNNSLFQVASQFNLLEMVNPNITPSQGITRYIDDRTQGPICAMCCAFSTLYRNYFTNINTLDSVQSILSKPYWNMINGYTIFNTDIGLDIELIEKYNIIKDNIKFGIHLNADVVNTNHKVSQIFCSAIPVSYNKNIFNLDLVSKIVLESAYEATFILSIITNKPVYITLLGGGAFGNKYSIIQEVIKTAFNKYKDYNLDVTLVNYKKLYEI